ncbi:MAG: hypothetical protein GY874_14190 [Desulfobacteraceae bacterium]|nr:hypothetical protein [Desulfobacteraceae bacterium]
MNLESSGRNDFYGYSIDSSHNLNNSSNRTKTNPGPCQYIKAGHNSDKQDYGNYFSKVKPIAKPNICLFKDSNERKISERSNRQSKIKPYTFLRKNFSTEKNSGIHSSGMKRSSIYCANENKHSVQDKQSQPNLIGADLSGDATFPAIYDKKSIIKKSYSNNPLEKQIKYDSKKKKIIPFASRSSPIIKYNPGADNNNDSTNAICNNFKPSNSKTPLIERKNSNKKVGSDPEPIKKLVPDNPTPPRDKEKTPSNRPGSDSIHQPGFIFYIEINNNFNTDNEKNVSANNASEIKLPNMNPYYGIKPSAPPEPDTSESDISEADTPEQCVLPGLNNNPDNCDEVNANNSKKDMNSSTGCSGFKHAFKQFFRNIAKFFKKLFCCGSDLGEDEHVQRGYLNTMTEAMGNCKEVGNHFSEIAGAAGETIGACEQITDAVSEIAGNCTSCFG